MCAGLSTRPFFAARHGVMLQLMRLATHCRDSWVRRRAPARMRTPLGDRFLMDDYPRPLEGGAPLLPCATSRPRASRSRPRSAATHQAWAVARGARSAWSMGHHRTPGVEASAGASAAAAGQDTRGTPTPWRAHVVRGSRPALRRAAWFSFPRTGVQQRRRYPLGSAGPALPPRPSQPRAPRRPAGARPPPPPPKDAGRTPPLGPGASQLQAPKTPQA